MPSQSDWVISLSRAHALVSCGYNYITISVSLLVSRAAPPASTAERNKNSWENIPIFIGTDRGEALFLLVSFGFFLVSHDRTDNTKKKERKKQQMTERTREREKETWERTWENERVLQPKTHEPQKHHFLQRKKTHENFVSQHIKWRAQKRRQSWESYKGKTGTGCVFNCSFSCVFSLFFLSDKRSARKVRERFCSFKRSDSLSEEGVCGSIPKQIIKRDESFSLFSIVLFSTNERTTKTILASSVVLSSLVVTESLVVVYHSFT